MTSKDPYQILGVSRQATAEDIKRAHRNLAKRHHPDRNPGDKSAEQRFKEVQAAYEVLGDPQRRAQYDRFGAGGPRPEYHTWTSGAPPFEDAGFDFDSLGDLTSIFEQFFHRRPPGHARRSARRPAPRGLDIEHRIDLTFEEALRGTTREIVLRGGTKPERIEVRIPAGVHDAQRIRVKGKGQDGPGGRGDLMIRYHIGPHPFFRRQGLDLQLDLPLSITEATLGARVEIPTPDGATLVSVPPGTASGTRLRLRERGVRDGQTQTRGDLFAVVRIVPPKRLSQRARQLLAELEGELDPPPRAGDKA